MTLLLWTAMVLLLGAAVALLCCITREDIKTRLISVRFLGALVGVRVLLAFCMLMIEGVCGTKVGGSAGLGSVAGMDWCAGNFMSRVVYDGEFSMYALMLSGIYSAVIMALLLGIESLAKRLLKTDATLLGKGDVLLIGACCLFLTPYQLVYFLFAAMVLGLMVALYYLVRYRDKTFPFAPAIAMACIVAFCL